MNEARTSVGTAASCLVSLINGDDDDRAFAGAVLVADAFQCLSRIEALLARR